MAVYNKKIVKDLALYFAEHGLPESYQAFKKDGKKPHFANIVANKVGAWETVLAYIEKDWPDYWKLAQPQPKLVPKSQDPLAQLRAGTIEK